ncbi:MAG: hypothetical protein LBM13_02870 [Candidatus Ancillula sp.]|jgi:DNA polymerase-3 subunit delta|nr:hypothetical protein [Candidatus Ancillula sp.]
MLTLIKGKDDFLRSRAKKEAIDAAKKDNPNIEVDYLDPENYTSGELESALSPSLLSDSSLVVIDIIDKISDDLIVDVVNYANDLKNNSNPEYVIILHPGIQRGKKMLDTIEKARKDNIAKKNVNIVDAKPLTPEKKKAFVQAEFRRNGKQIANDAIETLIEATSNLKDSKMGELVSFVGQISSDLPEDRVTVNQKDIFSYFHATRQVDTFKDVINNAFAGKTDQAMLSWRMVSNDVNGAGIIPQLIGGLAYKLRLIAKASSDRNPKELGLNPWALKDIKPLLGRFSTEKIRRCFEALADANIAAVGGSSDGGRTAFEKALLTISS